MAVQIAIYFLFIVFGYIYSQKNNSRSRLTYIIICSLILLLKASLRSVTIGSDTSHYAYYFYESMNTPWSTLINDFSSRYTKIGGELDAGYYLLQKVFSTFIPDFNLFTFFIQGLLFYWPLGTLVYRNTSNIQQILFAYTLMNALFMGLPMANARQVYAIGMCIWAFIYLLQKNYIKTGVFIMLGFFIHASALLFVLPVVFSFVNTKVLKTLSVAAFFLSFVVLLSTNSIISFMGNMVGIDRYASYGENEIRGGATTYMFLSMVICLFCLYGFYKIPEISDKLKNWFVMIPITMFFTPLIYSNGSMIRITMYFQIYFILLIPFTIDAIFRQGERKLLYFVFIAALIYLSVSSAGEYRFFWEENQDPLLNWT